MGDTEIFYGLNFLGGGEWLYMHLVLFKCLLSEHDIDSRREQACRATELCV